MRLHVYPGYLPKKYARQEDTADTMSDLPCCGGGAENQDRGRLPAIISIRKLSRDAPDRF